MKPSFQGEVQLAGWSESHNSGCKVTFWLADSDDLEAFRAMTVRKGNTAGQRLACVLVEIGDDEQPVQQDEKPPRDTSAWLALGPRCKAAIDLGANEAFLDYLVERGFKRTTAAAEKFIKDQCAIHSRRELDEYPELYTKFVRLVVKPFQAWARERQIA